MFFLSLGKHVKNKGAKNKMENKNQLESLADFVSQKRKKSSVFR